VRLYKALHRTVQRVFRGDRAAMFAARDKVCEEFDKSKGVSNQNSINELLKQGWDANKILSESVVQLQRKDEDRWDLNIRPGETHMFENNPFRFDNQRQLCKTQFMSCEDPNTNCCVYFKTMQGRCDGRGVSSSQ